MTTRKKNISSIKTPETIRANQDEAKVVKEEPKKPVKKEVDFSAIKKLFTAIGLKSGDSPEDKLSLIAIKFYQRMNKLPITGKLDDKTLEKMGL